MRHSALLLLLAVSSAALGDSSDFDVTGHTKLNATAQNFPDNSAFRTLLDSSIVDTQVDARLNIKWRNHGWAFDADYQLFFLHGDSVGIGSDLPIDLGNFFGLQPNDDRRLFNLTDVISDNGDDILVHRLDRLWLGYSSEKLVVRFGRQALSWGNGLFYAPMDLVNPFDPATIDTEYKAGDDMLYSQYLRDNGDDVQATAVVRRNAITGDVESGVATYALKYHGFASELEYDILVAESYSDSVLGIGLSHSLGGAQWSADLVLTDTENNLYTQLVTNLSYSWTLAGKNMSGILEYHFNGFGKSGGRYSPTDLADSPVLLTRVARRQMFTLGRHYLAGSVLVEVTPLWSVTPVVLANIGDPSALFQLTSNYSLREDMTLLGSINLPIGSDGTEFGGIESGQPGVYLSSDVAVFAQLAWYF